MPTVWVISDQTRTQHVYVEYVRHFANGWAVKPRYFALREHGDAIARSVPLLVNELESKGYGQGDLVLVLQDWEDGLLDEEDRVRRETGRRDIAVRLSQRLGGDPRRVHVRLVPPTTEGLYLLLAHEEVPGVMACLMKHVESNRTAEVTRLVNKRGAFARSGAEPTSAPGKREIEGCFGLRHHKQKGRLADAVRDALCAAETPRPTAPCLRELKRWLTRFAV